MMRCRSASNRDYILYFGKNPTTCWEMGLIYKLFQHSDQYRRAPMESTREHLIGALLYLKPTPHGLSVISRYTRVSIKCDWIDRL